MAIEDIEKRIIEEATGEAEKLKREAQEKKQEILKASEETCIECEKGFLEKGESSAEAKKRSILTPVRLKAKRDMLKAKQDIIDKAFSQALELLSKLNKTTYKRYLLGLYKKAPYYREVEIIPKKGKEKLISKTLEAIKKEYKQKNKEFKYKILKGNDGFSGGFILRSGKIEIDLTFDSLIGKFREELEGEVAKLLFKEGA